MSQKVIISSDSTTDLSDELIERYNIRVLNMKVVMGDKEYIDGIEAKPEDLYAFADRTGTLAKTSASSIGDTIEFFKELTKDGAEVVHFTVGAKLSTNNNNSRLAAMECPGVYVVDGNNLSTGTGLLVIEAAEMAAKGVPAAEIYEKVSALAPFVDASFVLDDLKYLVMGGRCSALAALGANLLKLKPCITVHDGVLGVEKKYRGKYGDCLKEYVAERLSQKDDVATDRIFVTHAGNDESIVNDIVAQVKATLPFKEVFVTRAGCTISAHCGQNTLGILFLRKTPLY